MSAAHPGVRHPRARRMAGWTPLTDALIGAFAALLVVVALWSAWSASPVGDVPAWKTWRASDQPLSLRYPAGWQRGELGEGELIHAFFMRSTWVRIHVLAGPLIAQLVFLPEAGSGYAHATLAQAHLRSRREWEQLFGPMQEGQMARTVLGGRYAVWSEFRYERGLLERRDEPMAGYRATIAGPGTCVLIAAVAPERAWREFQPIAREVIRSVRLGSTAQVSSPPPAPSSSATRE